MQQAMAKHDKAKLIIELYARKMSRRVIARTRHISAHTVKEVLDRASEKGVAWGDVSLMGDEEVAALQFPAEKAAEEAVARLDLCPNRRVISRRGNATTDPAWIAALTGRSTQPPFVGRSRQP